jgi:hypothetical protein
MLEVSMRKALTAGVAALTLGGAVAGAAQPASAAPFGGYHGGYYGHGGWRGGGPGLAIAAGVLGLAAGAAIADSHYHAYYGGPGYYPGPGYYGYGYGYGSCVGRQQVWDPYVGGYVVRSFRYAC